MSASYPWERPLGAHPRSDGQTDFRVWAPRARAVSLLLGDAEVALDDAGLGIYEAVAPAVPGDDYWFSLDGEHFPDPCSRWQPEGLRGPSRVFTTTTSSALPSASPSASPSSSVPSSSSAPGLAGQPARPRTVVAVELADLVIYELHVGTFSSEGTFDGVIPYLEELAALGVGAIEIMPVAEFPGQRGWGYDGVYLSAAQSSYGGPEGLVRLVQAAHRSGLAVILDVVYNHVGASGTPALEAFGPYFTDKYQTPWGRAINFDDADCDPVREWVLQSAEGWVRNFGIDGLRLDAIHAIFDSSAEHIVEAVARRVHAVNPRALVIAESGLNDPKVMRRRERGGYECDAAWADDFHHALRTLVTDDRDGYYAEFGRVADLAKAFHRPHVHDGVYSSFRRRCFGAPADDVPPERFVVFSQDHDQVGNRAFGDRIPAPARPLAAFCTLLAPFTPMLFMGEEYGEKAPFQFFSDHIDEEIAVATREGRRAEFAAFASFAHEIPDPQSEQTFLDSKLTRERDPRISELYAELLRIRRSLTPGEADEIDFDDHARWLRVRRGDYQLVCNFSSEHSRLPCDGTELVLSAGGDAVLADGHVDLPALSGVLIH